MWFLPLSTGNGTLDKMEPRMSDGIWLGIDGKDGTVKVGTAAGVVNSRTVRRKPLESRWSREEVDAIKETTWKANVPEDQVPAGEELVPENPMRLDEPGMQARRSRLLPSDFGEHGFTDGCDGCRAIQQEQPSRNHSEACLLYTSPSPRDRG